MSSAGLLRDLLAFSVQGFFLGVAAAILARVLPLERPALKLVFWQAVLAAALVLPFLGAWSPLPGGAVEIRFGSSPEAVAAIGGPGRAHWAEAVAAVLALGVVARGGRFARGVLRLRSCRRRAVPFDVSALHGLEQAAGVGADVRVSHDVAVPATFGWRRPMVLLPAHVQDLDASRLRAIVLHELIHVRRRDWPLAVAEEALGAVLWFHPAIHLALGRVRLAREQCVDQAVVEALGDRQSYLESLLEVARRRLRPDPVPAALFLGERHLSERVELLLKEVVMSKVRALCHLSLSAVLLAIVGAVATSSFPLSAWGAPQKDSKAAAKDKGHFSEPRLVHKVDPVYPPEAKKDHLEGLVHIETRLAKDGSVAEAQAIDGHATLAEAALAAVRQWRYEPVLGPDKKPVEVKMTITVNFRLDK